MCGSSLLGKLGLEPWPGEATQGAGVGVLYPCSQGGLASGALECESRKGEVVVWLLGQASWIFFQWK